MKTTNIFKPYINVAEAVRQEYQLIQLNLENPKLSDSDRKIIQKQAKDLKHTLDRLFRLSGDFVPAHASVEAEKYIVTKGKRLQDLFNLPWHKQPKFEGQKNRSTCNLVHEHKNPVSQLVKAVINSQTRKQISTIFTTLQEIVWITKAENKRLKRSNREDHNFEYMSNDIEIRKNSNVVGSIYN